MNTRGFWKLDDVSDERLVGRLRELIAMGCRTEARIVAHLAELDARDVHLRAGRSLFEYCQTELGLSENQAHYRIAAARAAERFPLLFELLDRHQIHLTTIALISKYLTQENHVDLIRDTHRLTKRQVLELLARRYPKPDTESTIRRLPPRSGEIAAGPTGTLEPLAANNYRLQLNASRQLVEKLELARDLLSHANPSGDLAVVVERALDTLIAKLKGQRFGQTQRSRQSQPGQRVQQLQPTGQPDKAAEGVGASPAVTSIDSAVSSQSARLKVADTPNSRARPNLGQAIRAPVADTPNGRARPNLGQPKRAPGAAGGASEAGGASRARKRIRNEVRRQLLARDGLRCTFVGATGHRCTARAFLEMHHEHAWAKGGSDTPGNLGLLCAAHNQLLAHDVFGRMLVRAAIERRRGKGGGR